MDPATEYMVSVELLEQLGSRIEYEQKRIDLNNRVTNKQAWRILADEAGRGDWELMRVRRYRDGRRSAWMRRKVIRSRLTIVN